MEQIAKLGTAIRDLIEPTSKIYGELLSKNAGAIKGTPRSTHRYGPHSRQELDVYRPSDFSKHADAPIVLFLHGGGFAFGAKNLTTAPEPDLVYTNLGHYFAEQCGYIAAVANYRLVGQHDAVYPSGGEDIALAVEFLAKQFGAKKHEGEEEGVPRDIFVLGHSAGGAHTATYMMEPEFKDRLEAFVAPPGVDGLRLRGFIYLGTPLHFRQSEGYRTEVGAKYFGKQAQEHSPMGLLEAYQAAHPDKFPLEGIQVLVMDCELDPENEIREPNEAYLGQWLKSPNQPMKDALSYRSLSGHNHISCVWGPGTGIEAEEGLGQEVSSFIDSIRRKDQNQRDIKIVQDSIKK